MKQSKALAKFLGCKKSEVEQCSYDADQYTAEGCDYLVLSDQDATEYAYNYIRESLWAFNADFLASYTKLPEEIFTALQPQCEGSNEAIKQIIGSDFKDFAEEAISADGRGHFVSSYDGHENECEGWFIYRIN